VFLCCSELIHREEISQGGSEKQRVIRLCSSAAPELIQREEFHREDQRSRE